MLDCFPLCLTSLIKSFLFELMEFKLLLKTGRKGHGRALPGYISTEGVDKTGRGVIST